MVVVGDELEVLPFDLSGAFSQEVESRGIKPLRAISFGEILEKFDLENVSTIRIADGILSTTFQNGQREEFSVSELISNF